MLDHRLDVILNQKHVGPISYEMQKATTVDSGIENKNTPKINKII